MRNLLLGLVLANLLLLAWQFWVTPSIPTGSTASTGDGLALYAKGGARVSAPAQGPRDPAATIDFDAGAAPAGSCFRLGPLPGAAAAQQTAQGLAARGIDATPIARDSQLWLGHWVQIAGLDSVPVAEAARERLVAGGLPDALLMQDGPQPMISLGVFRDRNRADRVAAAAQNLGFAVSVGDRYRPAVEQWLLVRPRSGQILLPADLGLGGDRILRAEPVPCGNPEGAAAPTGPGLMAPGADGVVPGPPE